MKKKQPKSVFQSAAEKASELPPDYTRNRLLVANKFNALVMRRANLSAKIKEAKLQLEGEPKKGVEGLNDKIKSLLISSGMEGAMVGNLCASLRPAPRTSFDKLVAAQKLIALGVDPRKVKKAFDAATTKTSGTALYVDDVTQRGKQKDSDDEAGAA